MDIRQAVVVLETFWNYGVVAKQDDKDKFVIRKIKTCQAIPELIFPNFTDINIIGLW